MKPSTLSSFIWLLKAFTAAVAASSLRESVWTQYDAAAAAATHAQIDGFFASSSHTNNWAVLVCTSRFWFNYRHIANTLSIYRTVKRLGIPDSNIILMLSDDVACNSRNHFPASIYNNAGRQLDLYGSNIEVDYRGYEVTVENFIRVLTGRHEESVPRSKRLLTDDRSNILLFMTGHGGDEFLKFQDAEEISSHDVADAIAQMFEKKRYNEILFMIDTCQAATMYSRIYSPNVIAAASSIKGESSYSHHLDVEIGVSVIDRWTYFNLETLERVNRGDKATMADLFASYNPYEIASTPGIRLDLFPRGAENALVTDFFGGVQNIELTSAGYPIAGANSSVLSMRSSQGESKTEKFARDIPRSKHNLLPVTSVSDPISAKFLVGMACIGVLFVASMHPKKDDDQTKPSTSTDKAIGWRKLGMFLGGFFAGLLGVNLFFGLLIWEPAPGSKSAKKPADIPAGKSNQVQKQQQQVKIHAPFPAIQYSTPRTDGAGADKVVWTDDNFKCIAWRQTHSCDPDGMRDKDRDKACNEDVPLGASGYCEIQDRTTGITYHVAKSDCGAIHYDKIPFRCNMAKDFANFPRLSTTTKYDLPVPINDTYGIIMAVKADHMPYAYASILRLRKVGCRLPIEIWTLLGELPDDNPILSDLRSNYNVKHRVVPDRSVKGYAAKIYAACYTSFQHILLMDGDNVVTRDPTYLFHTKEYLEHGAIFWPDYWKPGHTIFKFHEGSLAWELLGIAFVDMMEQESAQVAINRATSMIPLNIMLFYGTHLPIMIWDLKLVWGDKDLFRLAWLRAGQSFFMIPRLAGSAGSFSSEETFCGVTILQHDPAGEVLFFHRNALKKGESPENDKPQWTHMQEPLSPFDVSLVWEPSLGVGCAGVYELRLKSHIVDIRSTAYATLESEFLYDMKEALKLT